MSDADIELVRALQPAPDVDVAELFNDPERWSQFAANAAPFFTADFECAGIGAPQGELHARGIDGLREVFSEWLSPWASYRSSVEDVIGYGDRVLVLVHDRAVSRHDAVEVTIRAGSVWTMRDGRIARVEFHASRDTARRAAGV
jgi:ketosteroid isomerase-like protein